MRWVVASKGARDAYQVPLALASAGKLEALVTDWYSPFDRDWFKSLMRFAPVEVESQLRRRYREGLPSGRVRTMPLELARTKLDERSASDRGDNRLGGLAGRMAERAGAGLFSYSYYAHAAFENCRTTLPKLLFQVHPHPRSIRNLLQAEMELVPEARASLLAEVELSMPDDRFAQLCREPSMADACVAASGYTKRTLIENGVGADQVRVIPYGVDLELFSPPVKPREDANVFRVVFAGQMIQRKGLSYLLEAWRRLRLPQAELVIVGRGGSDAGLLAKYEGSFRLESSVSFERLRELYQTSDVCCVPSLVEGFGQVYLESLACGTPVIATPNTGAADFVPEAGAGFIVPIRDIDALSERLAWCHGHRAELAAMRVAARASAEAHTWDAFRRAIVDTVGDLETGEARAA